MHKKECIPSTFILSSACLSNDSLQMIMGTTFLTMIEQRSIIANLRHTLTLVLTFWAPFHATNPLIFICKNICSISSLNVLVKYEGYIVLGIFWPTIEFSHKNMLTKKTSKVVSWNFIFRTQVVWLSAFGDWISLHIFTFCMRLLPV